MYRLEEIERTETTVTAKLVPLKERRYVDENGFLVIEYYEEDDNSDHEEKQT
ncbi:MAG: hypothetical protein J6P40_07265 [Oscillospiraceae bacterium]|nr:hypothetical protein [Oscillospiraceae bacterium]